MGLISISKWGPSGWNFLHAVAFTYSTNPTQKEKKEIIDFLFSFANVIPCLRCRYDFKQLLHEYLFDGINSKYLNSKVSLSNFIIDLHNQVNIKLNKKELSYKQVYKLYYNPNKSGLNYVLIVLIICVCIIYSYKYMNKKNKIQI